jgi:glyoxylase-like metal-dependent hydrolase (beta-lactamase superfamily II)
MASPLTLPAASANQVYVTISALESGQLTLPEKLFVTDADPDKYATVPSLSFLIRHPSQSSSGKDSTAIVFDLGVARDVTSYPPAMQTHIANRQPTIHHPDTADSLRAGGLEPAKDIDVVMLSHVHWDHTGTPSDFASAQFVVGSGTLHLLREGAPPHYPKELFHEDLLPKDRTKELPPVASNSTTAVSQSQQTGHKWSSLFSFPAAADFFGDGSVYIIDSPGHLFGHMNLLCRTGPKKWVYLGGDCCHDVRILTGEKDVALYDDGHGHLRSVHVDTDKAKNTLANIRPLLKKGEVVQQTASGDREAVEVEVIVAHDGGWRERNKDRFFPGTL